MMHATLTQGINMQAAQHESIFSTVRKVFENDSPAQKSAPKTRPLTEDELLAVAGGPECEVGMGT